MFNKIVAIILLVLVLTSCSQEQSMSYEEHEKDVNALFDNKNEISARLEEVNKNYQEILEQKQELLDQNTALLGEIEIQTSNILELEQKIDLLNSINENLEKQLEEANEKENERLEDRINYWNEYEAELSAATSYEEIFNAYRTNLDGAYADGYASKLYNLVTSNGIIEFIDELNDYKHLNHYKSGIIYLLMSEIDTIHYNAGTIDIEEYRTQIIEHLEQDDLGYYEIAICYQMLDRLEGL